VATTPTSERRRWWTVFGLVTAAGLVWALATPLFTGPDEVSQARRAAAVARGQLTGRQERPDPALLLTVDVPGLYGRPAEDQWLCHLGPLVEGAPQEPMALPSPPCPDLGAADPSTVAAETVQYRGQPFFYALVGAPTLVDRGLAGAYAMRAVAVLLTAALVASAAVTLAGTGRPALAGLGLLGCLTPGVLYLSGSTNPSAVEIAAALSAWAAVAALAGVDPGGANHTGRRTGTGGGPVPAPGAVDVDRLVRRLGAGLVVLTLCRGLGPAFAAAVVLVGGVAAGWARSRALLRRADLRWWAGAVVVATGASAAWLAHISGSFPLPDRPGSGWADAFGWLPWYLRQSVGVFGTNDSAVSPAAAVLWCLVVVGVTTVGVVVHLRARRPRTAALAVTTLVGGLALNVTAEGLSLPPIGFFWQGRYALPLLVGGVVLAAVSSPDEGVTPHGGSTPGPMARGLWVPAAALLVAVHAQGFLAVARHHGSPAGAAAWIWVATYATVITALAVTLGRRPVRPPVRPPRSPGVTSPPSGDPPSSGDR
jgi:hypothetical protein